MSSIAKIVAAVAVIAVAGYAAGRFITQEPAPQVTAVAPPKPALGSFTIAEPRKPVAEVVFQDAEGRQRTLAEFKGKVVLVNFWATWCAPCIAEMPSLDALQAKLGPEKFALVALSQDRGGMAVAKKWLDDNKLANIPAYVADQAQARAMNTMSQLPVSILLDSQGREVGRILGATDWMAPAMIERIKALMAET